VQQALFFRQNTVILAANLAIILESINYFNQDGDIGGSNAGENGMGSFC